MLIFESFKKNNKIGAKKAYNTFTLINMVNNLISVLLEVKKFSRNDVPCSVASVVFNSLHPVDCVAFQAPLSKGFSGQEYWSGLP